MSDALAKYESLRGYRIRMNRSLLTDQLETQQLSAIAHEGGGNIPVSQAPFRTIDPPFHGDGDQVTMKRGRTRISEQSEQARNSGNTTHS